MFMVQIRRAIYSTVIVLHSYLVKQLVYYTLMLLYSYYSNG